jgi:hypothetical protein
MPHPQGYLSQTYQSPSQPPPLAQAYPSQLSHTYQSQQQLSVQHPPSLLSPNPALTLRESLVAQQNQLRQWETTTFDLIDELTNGVPAGHIETAVGFYSQWTQAAAQYREKCESMVREMEAMRTALVPSSPHTIPNTHVYSTPQHTAQGMASSDLSTNPAMHVRLALPHSTSADIQSCI